MFIWIFYWIPFNIVVTTFICAVYSANIKVEKQIIKKFGDYKKFSDDNDIAEKIMRFIQLAFLCLCPALNIILAIYLVIKWTEFRDEIATKAFSLYEKKRIKYELGVKNNNE